MHDDSALDYSLAGAFARLVALGMPFSDAVAAVTINPARVLGEEAEIGTLSIGSRADVTVLEERIEDWPMRDGQGEILVAERRWLPRPRARAGQPVVPTGWLVRDVAAPAARAYRKTVIDCAVDRAIATAIAWTPASSPNPVELLRVPQTRVSASSARRIITGKAVRMSHIKASMASSSSLEVECRRSPSLNAECGGISVARGRECRSPSGRSRPRNLVGAGQEGISTPAIKAPIG